jgi:signal-transduction protein with cAMP-binding, CBS, and nucleotidyltransferase domain
MIESKFLQDNVKNIQFLMTIPGLHQFEADKLGKLLRLSRTRKYEKGEYIIRQGEQDPYLYFLLSGKVSVLKDDMLITQIDSLGEIFGEMRLLDRQVRSASVVAEEPTLCLAVDTSGRERLILGDDRANFLLFLYKMLGEYSSARLRLTNEELIKCKKALAESLLNT